MPVSVQAFFVADRVKALATEHPEWRTTEPFKSQLAGDVQSVMAQGLDFFDDKAGKPVAINKFITTNWNRVFPA